MKTYIYTYRKVKNDVNGNPRHWVTVYRVKRNQPIQLCGDEDVGYGGIIQTVYDVIAEKENWGKKKHHYSSGFNCNGVAEADRNGKIKVVSL